MALEEIAKFVADTMDARSLKEAEVAARLPGGLSTLRSVLSGRRWLQEAEAPAWGQALQVGEEEIVGAVARQHRRLAAVGFYPDSDRQREREEELLLSMHLPRILAAHDEILGNPELATCVPVCAQVSTMLSGSKSIPLEVLLKTWAAGEWRALCTDCDGDAHVVRVGMSALSGTVWVTGVCTRCGRFGRMDGRGYGKLSQWSRRVFETAAQWFKPRHEAWVSGSGPLWPDAALPLRTLLERLGIQIGDVPSSGQLRARQLWDAGLVAVATFPVEPTTAPRPEWGKVEGMLMGVAVGDALGNTTESMLPTQRHQLHGDLRDYLPNRYARGRAVGLPSDDTQLTFRGLTYMLGDHAFPQGLDCALTEGKIFGEGGTVQRWRKARQLAGDSPGWSTRQTVRNAGNGALMRAAGVFGAQIWRSRSWTGEVLVSSAMTHDGHASNSACLAFCQMWAELMQFSVAPSPEWWWTRYVEIAAPLEGNHRLKSRVSGFNGTLSEFVAEALPDAFERGLTVFEAQETWHSGAYLLETVPTVLYTLAVHGHDPEEAMVRAATDSWDNDTIAAIVGACVGALHGVDALPARWVEGLLGRLGNSDDGEVQRLLVALRESLD